MKFHHAIKPKMVAPAIVPNAIAAKTSFALHALTVKNTQAIATPCVAIKKNS
jgi:hypothetical protein